MKRLEAHPGQSLCKAVNPAGFFQRLMIVALLACGIVPVRAVILPGQPLAVAHFDLVTGAGYATNALRLQLGYFSPGDGFFNTAPLFNQFILTNGSAGQVFLLTPETDPDFASFAGILSNGDNNGLGLGGLEVIYGFQEPEFFEWLVPGGNGIDLAGFQIGAIAMQLSNLVIDSPGSNPNNDGNWTEVSFAGTFTVYAVPEPTVIALFGIGVGSLLFHRARSAQAIPRSTHPLGSRGCRSANLEADH